MPLAGWTIILKAVDLNTNKKVTQFIGFREDTTQADYHRKSKIHRKPGDLELIRHRHSIQVKAVGIIRRASCEAEIIERPDTCLRAFMKQRSIYRIPG